MYLLTKPIWIDIAFTEPFEILQYRFQFPSHCEKKDYLTELFPSKPDKKHGHFPEGEDAQY